MFRRKWEPEVLRVLLEIVERTGEDTVTRTELHRHLQGIEDKLRNEKGLKIGNTPEKTLDVVIQKLDGWCLKMHPGKPGHYKIDIEMVKMQLEVFALKEKRRKLSERKKSK